MTKVKKLESEVRELFGQHAIIRVGKSMPARGPDGDGSSSPRLRR